MADTDLARAVSTVVERCLAVRAGESVLVVADPDREALGHALHAAALAADADSVLTVLPPRPQRGTEPPPTVAAAFAAADVFLAPCLPSLSHTTARKAASEAGARGATLPGVTEDLLARLMSVDFDRMAARSRAVADLLTSGAEARLTCPSGSELTLDLSERAAIADDGDLTARGAFGNLPCGEGFIAPRFGEGRLMATTVGGLGRGDAPVEIEVERGQIAHAHGDLGAAFVAHLTAHGDLGRTLAELGVGTNDRATMTGNVLEDEKVLGTVHVAFGASAGIGGTVSVPVHDDCVVVDPTLTVDGTVVVDAGRFVLQA
jgi:leucyl aminopeptidase (aminopeptidase T)